VEPIYYVIFALGGLTLGVVARHLYGKGVLSSAEREGEKRILEATSKAEHLVREAELKAQTEVLKRKEEFDKEIQSERADLKEQERRLLKLEEGVDRKGEVIAKKERFIEGVEKSLAAKQKELRSRRDELDAMVEAETEKLHEIAQFTPEQARDELFRRLEEELGQEVTSRVKKRLEDAAEQADDEARNIIMSSIHRCASDTTATAVTSSVDIPNDEMKGRIIGREGRNIRAFEKATGVDVIVDDTPGVIVVSGFDSIRREIARRSMEKLILDGRIHPARIEELVTTTRKEVEDEIRKTGKQTCYDLGLHRVHQRIVELLGRLKYRTSFGQNVLQHSIEVASISGAIASEMKLDNQLARRCGLLHDIGKALDHEMEGGHPEIGADIAKRCDESREVVDAVGKHHEDANGQYIYTVLISAADAISASRPGARRESFEKYIKRLEKLEDVANSFDGVDSAFAIQAGREIRVIVNSEKVDDKQAFMICRNIAQKIQSELSYPGEVKVTLIRETRVVEVAR
jgi:ribonuclease Y